jgi:hypothetical protein
LHLKASYETASVLAQLAANFVGRGLKLPVTPKIYQVMSLHLFDEMRQIALLLVRYLQASAVCIGAYTRE